MLAEASSAQDKAHLAALKALMTQNDTLRGQVAEVRRELKSLRAARQGSGHLGSQAGIQQRHLGPPAGREPPAWCASLGARRSWSGVGASCGGLREKSI